MIDTKRLKEILSGYKKDFVKNWWPHEKYIWEAIKHFQDNWDIKASDFAEMLHRSLEKTNSLLQSKNNYPKRMIEFFAKTAPEEVRAMFSDLYDEKQDVYQRIKKFKESAEKLLVNYGNDKKSHYQKENAISVYLWLKFPEKCYIFKFEAVKKIAEELKSKLVFKKGKHRDNLKNSYALYEELRNELRKDNDLVNLLKSNLTNTCYSDPEFITLTMNVGFYIYKPSDEKKAPTINKGDEERYWWLNASPGIWKFSDIAIGDKKQYTFYTEQKKKRRVFKNFLDAKTGDKIIGYESRPVQKIVAIGKVSEVKEGQEIYFEKTEQLSNPIEYSSLKECPELKNMEYIVKRQGSLFKLTKDEYEFLMNKIHEKNPSVFERKIETYSQEQFLDEVYITKEKYNRLVSVLLKKKNIILQGAPGVGKTFAAKRLAYSIMGEKDDSRIGFVQFHQNYSYEDFIMGYKPQGDSFVLKEGIFYRFCKEAANNPDKDYFFIIDEINRGNMSKIFGELLMLIEKQYRGTEITLAYNGQSFSVPDRLHIIGMMNTADRSLAMIDYALRRRFSFFDMEPGFDSEGFKKYQKNLNNETFNSLIDEIVELNGEIAKDKSLGKGFCIGHSYFCGAKESTTKEDMKAWLNDVVDFDILPMLSEYWFDDFDKVQHWESRLHGIFQ